MKRIISGAGDSLGYLEFRADINFWLPAFGSLDGGYALGQTVVLGFLAAMIFRTALALSYRFLSRILD